MQDQMSDLTHSPRRPDTPVRTDIVVVNWNAGDMLLRCVESIRDHGDNRIGRTIVVDNGSTDGSDEIDVSDIDLEVIRANANLGFGRACNLGSKAGHSPYILFLNPDAALMPGTVSTMLDFMERPENAKIGVCGAKLLDEDGHVQRHCANLPTPTMLLAAASGIAGLLPSHVPTLHDHTFDHLSSRTVDHVIGACYLIRRPLFEVLDGFDERFFVYLEDLDLSARVQKAGYTVYYLAEAVGLHRGGGTSEQVKPQRLAYSLESRIAYAFKHFPRPSATAVAAATLVIEPVPRLVRAVAKRSGSEARDTLLGFQLLWQRVFASPAKR